MLDPSPPGYSVHFLIHESQALYRAPRVSVDVSKCVDHNKLWKILKEMRLSDHLTCLLRNLYAGQEATVRTGHGQETGSNWERSTSRLYIVTLLI